MKEKEVQTPEQTPTPTQTPAVDNIGSETQYKRNIACKLRIGKVLSGTPKIENERLKSLETEGKSVVRVNIIANIIDKYIQEGEKKFASITLDDATGQIKAKVFGDDIALFSELNQGDTILCIGLLRTWNNEIYITPEILKPLSPQYLLIRKLETDLSAPKALAPEKTAELKDKILNMIKSAESEEGIFIDKIIMDTHEPPEIINGEIKKLLENGLIYEPRPGKLRYLG
ncbi:hypothetical protein CMI45_00965 [Candidatus Pacearchaeota archaeon]|nr:hypothetical protein [Candidatus Pacearchaeota archaeon]|tara:strand:- start:639 stop:1325 length:687 start_codon:yes stop_codon:yes gene_type:complete